MPEVLQNTKSLPMSKTRNTKSLPNLKVRWSARSPQPESRPLASLRSARFLASSCSLPLRGLRAKVDPRRRLRLLLVLPFAPFGKSPPSAVFFLIWVVFLYPLCLLVVVVLLFVLVLFCLCQGGSASYGITSLKVGKKRNLLFLPLLYCGLGFARGTFATP